MTDHTALLWLPDALRRRGINVVELAGWRANEPNYFWVTPGTPDTHRSYEGVPNGWMWHHTASHRYAPYVKNQKGQTKANLWMGLLRDGRLHHDGGGTPTVVFASSGPADFSSGSGCRELLEANVMRDRRFHGPQRGPDDQPEFFGNRYYGNTEIVHPGHGEPLDPGVWAAAVTTAELMCRHWTWQAWRHVGHNDHTSRKVDIRFAMGAPYSIAALQDQVHTALAGGASAEHPFLAQMLTRQPSQTGDDTTPRPVHWTDDINDDTWAQWYADGHIEGDPTLMPDYYFSSGDATTEERINAFNVAMQAVSRHRHDGD